MSDIDIDAIRDETEKAWRFLRNVRLDPATVRAVLDRLVAVEAKVATVREVAETCAPEGWMPTLTVLQILDGEDHTDEGCWR